MSKPEHEKALSYLESFVDYERKAPEKYDKRTYSLARTKKLLNYLGSPHNSIKAIHIAGTNGKGSTGAMLTSILKESNLRAGFYSSPHLVSFRERIRIGEELISEEEICTLLKDVKAAVEKLKKHSSETPSFFEVYTALAFLYFANKEVDFAVLEVGMGGRLDATNVVKPEVSVFTDIDIDHTGELGTTRLEIAREKSGIIKQGVPVITTAQEEDVLSVIFETCKEKNCAMTEVRMGNDSPGVTGLRRIHLEEKAVSLEGCKFRAYGTQNSYGVLSTSLLGAHQIPNAGLALCCAEHLGIVSDCIERGLGNTVWPGRIQLFPGNPPILLDGAHNPSAAGSLASTIKRLFPGKKVILIFGVCSDKDINGVGKELFPVADKIIFTKADNPRAAGPSYLKKAFARFDGNMQVTDSSVSALKTALSESSANDLICVAGSFFLVGEILRHINP